MFKSKKQNKNGWMIIAILIFAISIPSSMVVKLLSNEIDAFLLSVLRNGIITLALLPFVIRSLMDKKHRRAIMKKMPLILLISVLCSVSAPFTAKAVELSCASFVEVLFLIEPIIFAIISIIVTHDRISRESVMGLLLVVLGSIVMVVIPMITGEGTIHIYGLVPIILIAVSVVLSSIWSVYLRKLDEDRVPLVVTLGISFAASTVAATGLAINDSGLEIFSEVANLSIQGWLMIIYLAIGVSVVVRFVRTKAYEHIGTAAHASTSYIYYLFAIALPMIILGEALGWEMIVGAILIGVGIILTRQHTHRRLHHNKKLMKWHKHFAKHGVHRRHI